MPLRIEDYAIIGDTETAAVVGKDGSIDWLCLPRFDSAACFAALLGGRDNGHWQIAPKGTVRSVRRRYRGQSALLETEFETDTGAVRLVDCMPVRDNRADVVRRVEGIRGSIDMRLWLVVRFGYGRIMPWVRRMSDREGVPAIVAIAGPDALCLRGNVVPEPADHRHYAEFTVSAGESLDFSLTWFRSHEPIPPRFDTASAIAGAERWWRQWADHCSFAGDYAEAVHRSLMVLKALTYQPTGGIVAAVTTSLPERFGGERNWDYRYCWLRDASLTLWSLLATGYAKEATRWRRWLLRALAGDPQDLQILYGVAGERWLPEYELDWLPGYQHSRPVRVGNDAALQFQGDVVGEVMDALHYGRTVGIAEDKWSWPLQLALMGYLEDTWRRPDNGIWEIRGAPRPFTHSRLMVWTAFDRAVRACEDFGADGPVDRWRALRDEVAAEILAKGWNADLGSFTQYYGGTTLDAALLLIPHTGFLPADDPRVLATIGAVERELRDGIFVRRYSTDSRHDGSTLDGLPPGEYAFLACSFWLVSAYARAGRIDEARAMFEELLSLRNDVGLLSEEYDPASRRMAGNFPQAFSHLALVEAAHAIAEHAKHPGMGA